MAVTPFAQKYYPPVSPNIQPEVQQHLKLLYDAVNDHDQAITTQQSQVQAAAAAAAAAAASTSTNTVVTKTVTQIAGFPGLGNVNNQTGTSYTLQGSDSGALVTLENGGAIAVTLNSAVGTPYLVFLTNYGPGTATLTPSSGTVNGGASYALAAAYTSVAFFDGVNWWVTASQLQAADVTNAADLSLLTKQTFSGEVAIGTFDVQFIRDLLGNLAMKIGVPVAGCVLINGHFLLPAMYSITNNQAATINNDGSTEWQQSMILDGLLQTNGIQDNGASPGIATDGNLDVTGDATFAGAVTLSANPALPLEAAPKQYVDAAISGASGTVNLAKLTTGGTDGTLTVLNGLITAFTNPT